MAKLKIYSDIVDEETKMFLGWSGMDAMAFSDIDQFIAAIPEDDEEINLTINCRGGMTDTALAMYDALRATGKTISAEVIGECSSSATLLLLSARADLRRAHQNASILIHNPYISGFVEGDAKQVGAIADSLGDVQNKFLDIYVDRTGSDRATLQAIMDEGKPMSVAKAIELGFISETILPISAKNNNPVKNHTNMNFRKKVIDALAKALGVYAMELETADGKTLELEKESGEPVVGDVVSSEDGEYIMPDGTTIVVTEGVIAEIRPAEGEADDDPDAGGEETDTTLEQNETDSEKDAEIDRLKAVIAEKDAEIDRLKEELENATAQAKSEDDIAVLDMVNVAGGIDWLKSVKSQGKVDKRSTDSTTMNKMQAKAGEDKISFTEYHKRKAEAKAKKK